MDVTELQNPTEYMPVAQAWLEFVVKYFATREISILMADIMAHVGIDKSENLEADVQSVLSILLAHIKDFHTLFGLDQLLPLIDLLKPGPKVTARQAPAQLDHCMFQLGWGVSYGN